MNNLPFLSKTLLFFFLFQIFKLDLLANNLPRIRDLPYPFNYAISLADDIDATTWVDDIAIKKVFFDDYGLDFPRSSHIFNPKREYEYSVSFTNRPDSKLSNYNINHNKFENQTLHLIQSFHRGEIDYIHAWSDFGLNQFVNYNKNDYEILTNKISLINSKDIFFKKKKDYISTNTLKIKNNEPVNFIGMKFKTKLDKKVRGLVLVIKNKDNSIFNICFGKIKKKKCNYNDSLINKNKWITKSFLFSEVKGKILDYKFDTLRFEIYGDNINSVLFKDVSYSNFNRSLVKNNLELLKKFDINFLTYSDHGAADNGINIFNHSLAKYDKSFEDIITKELIENNAEASNKFSDYHFTDLLIENNFLFFLLGNRNNTNKIKSIEGYNLNELLIPYSLPDGNRIYEGLRYYPYLKQAEHYKDPYAVTWNDSFGNVLDDIFQKIQKNNSGTKNIYGPIVTHLGFHDNKNNLIYSKFKTEDLYTNVFNSKTIKKIELLSNKYYNFFNNIDNEDRIWVTGISRLYLYSLIKNKIKENISFDAKKNILKISSWQDDFLNKSFPNKDFPGHSLSGITLFLKDANNVKVEIDNKRFNDYVVNDIDVDEQESITFIDTRTRKIIANKIWNIDENNNTEVISTNDETYLRIKGSDDFNKIKFNLNSVSSNISRKNSFCFDIKYKGKKNKTQIEIYYILKDGIKYSVKTNFKDSKNNGWHLRLKDNSEWNRYCYNFNSVKFKRLFFKKKRIPRGYIKEFSININSTNDIFIKNIFFARDNPSNSNFSNSFILGRVNNHEDDVDIILINSDNTEFRTKTSHSGYFWFRELKPKTIFKIYADYKGKKYFSDKNFVELGSTEIDIKIKLENKSKNYNFNFSGLKPNNRKKNDSLTKYFSNDSFINFQTYKPNRLINWKGTGRVQEYDSFQYANNIGLLDRDRDFLNIDMFKDSLNIILFGDCLTSGAQFETYQKANLRLERLLNKHYGIDVNIPNFSFTNFTPYHFSEILNKYGRIISPKYIFVTIMNSTFRNVNPDLVAESAGLLERAWHSDMLDYKNGEFIINKKDELYFLKTKKWSRDWRGGSSHQLSNIENPTVWMEKEMEKSEKIFEESMRILKKKALELDSKLVLILVQDKYSYKTPDKSMNGENTLNTALIDKRLKKISKKLDFEYINYATKVKGFKDYKHGQWFYDSHWTPYGHKMFADFLFDYLIKKEKN